MTQVQLKRFECSDRGTAGILLVNDMFVCMTLERAWHLNTSNISCVPTGQYIAKGYRSSHHGPTFKIQDVPDRTGILFHKGNEIIHSTGCILLGQTVKVIQDKFSLASSTIAFDKFMRILQRVNQFTLRIS